MTCDRAHDVGQTCSDSPDVDMTCAEHMMLVRLVVVIHLMLT